MAAAAPSPSFRRTTISALLLLWLSGATWIVFHYFFPAHTDFGLALNPLEPVLMKIHGALAVFAVALLGWVSARHIGDNWPRAKKRKSGIAILTTYILLVLSGYALYYVLQDELRERIGQVHEALGVIAVAIAVVHWFRTGTGNRERLTVNCQPSTANHSRTGLGIGDRKITSPLVGEVASEAAGAGERGTSDRQPSTDL